MIVAASKYDNEVMRFGHNHSWWFVIDGTSKLCNFKSYSFNLTINIETQVTNFGDFEQIGIKWSIIPGIFLMKLVNKRSSYDQIIAEFKNN